MKMKKMLALVMSLVLMMTAFVGCASNQPTEKTAVRICGIKGPTGIGLSNLWDAQEQGIAKNDYSFELVTVPQDAGNMVVTGEADIAAVPTNLAAALYKKTGGKVQMLAVNTLGVLYIVEKGNTIQSVADLKGKTIYSTGEGANPEYILRHVLSENGIDPDKDVTLKFVTENDELNTMLATGQIDVALVAQPNVTVVCTKNADLRVAVDMNAEWEKLDSGKLMMGCVIVNKEFADNNPEAVANFLEEYKASIEKANENVDATAELCAKYEIIPAAAVAQKAIPNCNLTFVAGADMQAQITGYFEVLYNAKAQSIGGAMPDDGLYYQAK